MIRDHPRHPRKIPAMHGFHLHRYGQETLLRAGGVEPLTAPADSLTRCPFRP
jgi:hypothetical protein